MSNIGGGGGSVSNTVSKGLFSESQASLANGADIDSGWINMETVSKYQVSYFGSAALSLSIESREADSGAAELITPANYSGVFYLADLPVRQKWMKFVLTNSTGSAVTDAVMAIKGIYGGVDGASVFPIEIAPSQFSPAMLVQAVLRGQDPFNNFKSVGVNQAGALLSSDFGTEVARGLYPGYAISRKFGRNTDIDTTTTPEDIYNGGSVYTGFNATANENIAVVSSDANDTGTLVSSGTTTGGSTTTVIDSSGTFVTDSVTVNDVVLLDGSGYHGFVKSIDSETQLTVYTWLNGNTENYAAVTGLSYRIARAGSTGGGVLRLSRLLNADFEEQTTAYVILNGTSTVTLTGDYMRCSTCRVINAGSSEHNEGNITVNQATTTANVFAVIPPYGRTTIGASTIPTGKNGVMKSIQVGITRANGSLGSATIIMYVRERGSNAFTALQFFELSTSSPITRKLLGGDLLTPGTDFKFTVEDVSDNNTVAEVDCEYYLIDEEVV